MTNLRQFWIVGQISGPCNSLSIPHFNPLCFITSYKLQTGIYSDPIFRNMEFENVHTWFFQELEL